MYPVCESVLCDDAEGATSTILIHCHASAGRGGDVAGAVALPDRPGGHPAWNGRQEITPAHPTSIRNDTIIGAMELQEREVVSTG